MNMRKALVPLVMVVLVGLASVWSQSSRGAGDASPGASIAFPLVRPAFAQQRSYLEDTAGIVAWVDVGRSLDLASIKTALSGVEQATDSFTIGTVTLTGVPEQGQPHALVTTDGLVVAYFLRGRLAQMVYPPAYASGTDGLSVTTLTEAIRAVVAKGGVNYGAVQSKVFYYNFEYPTATNIMVATEWWNRGEDNSFTVTIPSNVTLFAAEYFGQAGEAYTDRWEYKKIDVATLYGPTTVVALIADCCPSNVVALDGVRIGQKIIDRTGAFFQIYLLYAGE